MASIRKNKKTKKWYCRVYYTDEEKTGRDKYQSKMLSGFDTKKEAEIAASKLQNDLENKNAFKAEHIIFSDYFEKWCETHKLGKFSPRTEKKYLREIKYVKKFFGNITLAKLNRQKYQDYIDWRGKGNGYDIVQKSHGRLKSCIQQARADGLINIDPSHGIALNYDNKGSDRIKYWNLNDSQKLLRSFSENPSENNVMLYIALTTGLRIGEIYALSGNSFDFEKNTLTVSKGYDYAVSRDFTDTKNKWSKRTIIITDDLKRYIKSYQFKFQKEYTEYLFLRDKKPCISHNGITKHLKKVCKELNIEQLTIHCLRHTHCSLLIFKDVSIHYISKRLGHKNVTETLETYTHVIDELEQTQDEKIIDVLDSLSNG